MIRAIVAVDEKWGIGKKNDLLFRLPAYEVFPLDHARLDRLHGV